MRNWGYIAGAGIRGQQDAYDRRRRAEEFDKEAAHREYLRDRGQRLDEQLDPIRVEGAQIDLSGARRREDFDEFADPIRRGSLERQDRAGERAEQYDRYTLPHRMRASEREDQYGEATQDYRIRAAGRADRSGARREQEEIHNAPLRRRAADRADQMGGIRLEREQRGFDSEVYYESARNALANFNASGNPRYIEDHYNEMMPDGHSVSITKAGPDHYIMKHSSGQTVQGTKRELLESSEEFFMQAPAMDSHPMNDINRRGRDRLGSAYMQRVDDLTTTLVQQGMDPIEARMQAHAQANQKSQMSPREAEAEYFSDMMEKLLPSNSYTAPSQKQIQEAEARATELTERYMQRFYGRSAGGAGDATAGGGIPDGGGPSVDIASIPNDFIQRLRENAGNPQARAEFDAYFGTGAADAVLGNQ